MDPSQPISAEAPGNAGPQFDARLQPTPDYGNLGPGSDVTGLGAGSSPRPVPQRAARVSSLIAASAGVFVALVVGTVGRSHPAWPAMAKLLSPGQNQATPAKDVRQLAEMQEQKQAETLLELAVAQKAGATEQISSYVDRWQGKLTWNSRMANLTAAALDSNDMRVRVLGSIKKFTNVLPRSAGTFLISRVPTCLKASAVSRIRLISSADNSRSPSKSLRFQRVFISDSFFD